MKRFCVVSFCNIYVLPYAKLYIDSIIRSGNSCTLLFWDRDSVNGDNDKFENCSKIVYQKKIKSNSSKLTKFFGYLRSTAFFKKELKRGSYDGIVFLQTHSAVFCQKVLCKHYPFKYVIDIRDFTLENYSLYRKSEAKVIKKAYRCVISSPAYSSFLPESDYVVAHNFVEFPKGSIDKIRNNAFVKPIKISFIGTVRFLEMDKKILTIFKNDERFQINYYGTGSDYLKKYCEDNDIRNADFHGSFSPADTADFYLKTDIINNLYGNHSPFLDYALSNKLYHSGQFYKPILVCPNTFMEEVSKQYKMGFVFDVENPDKEALYNWFIDFNRKEFEQGCDAFIQKVKNEIQDFYTFIDNVIEEV